MQNSFNSFYIKKSNVINIKSEILFREAEDDFFYFNKINSASKKLNAALKLTPNHLKSIILFADILFIKNNVKKALKFYLSALDINDDSPRIYGAAANCYLRLKNYKLALCFIESAISKFNFSIHNIDLYSQLIELKIDALIHLNNLKQAYYTYIKEKNLLNDFNSDIINRKLKILEKINNANLKIV